MIDKKTYILSIVFTVMATLFVIFVYQFYQIQTLVAEHQNVLQQIVTFLNNQAQSVPDNAGLIPTK